MDDNTNNSNIDDVPYSELTYEQKLHRTQNTKDKILAELSRKGNGPIPTDKDSVELMLKVMDSMDKVTISDKRINVDTESNKTNADIADALVAMIKNAKNVNPFAVEPGEAEGNIPKVDASELPEFTHAEGEDVIGIINETSEDFNRRMESAYSEKLKEMERELDE